MIAIYAVIKILYNFQYLNIKGYKNGDLVVKCQCSALTTEQHNPIVKRSSQVQVCYTTYCCIFIYYKNYVFYYTQKNI